MKKLLLTILFFAVMLGGLRAQVYVPVNGSVDDSTKNRKIFISFHSATCNVYDTAFTWSWTSGYAVWGKAFTIPAGCGYGVFKFKMVNCFGDTIERLDYYDSTRNPYDTLSHSFKYCDTCDLVSANFSATRGSLTVNFGNYSNNANLYIWHFGDSTTSNAATPTKVYSSAGYYNVCLIALDTLKGCADTFCKTIPVGPVCHFFSANFSHSSIVNKSVSFWGVTPLNANKFKWDFGDSTTSNVKYPPLHTYSTPGQKDVCFTAWDTINNCVDSQCYIVDIPDPCSGFFYAGFTDSVNHATKTVQFVDTSGPNSNKYVWYFGDATTSGSKNPSHTYGAYGTYTVCQVATDTVNGCKDSVCRNIVINNVCVGFSANFSYSAVDSLVTFTNTSSPGANKFSWTFGNSQSSMVKHPVQGFANGSYTVCLVARDTVLNCKDSFCRTVAVFNCKAFNGSFNSTVTADSSVFTNTTSVPPGVTASYQWDFGDASTSTVHSPVHYYTSPGSYNVCLYIILSNGCQDTVCTNIVVPSHCSAFTANFNYTLTNGTGVNFTNTSSSNANDFNWTFGDGNTSASKNPFHNYAFTDTFNVCMIARDTVHGCADTVCKDIIIVGCGHLAADFSIGKDSCMTVSFTNNSSGANATSWYFGDSNQVHYGFGFPYTTAHHYNASGNYTVCLVAKDTVNGCKDSTCNNGVVVGPGILGMIYRDSSWQVADSCIVYLIKVTIDTVANDTILTAVDSTYSNGLAGYMFSNVPYGDYLIKAALLPGSAFYANRIPTYYGDETQWRYASTVTVNSFCAWAPITLTTGTNPGGSGFIGGYVSVGANKYGDPIPDVQVNLYNADESPFGYTYTDGNGEYRFDNLLYGTYKVIVEVPGKPCQELWVSVSQGSPTVTGLNYEVNTKDITLKLGGGTGIEEAGNGMFTLYPNPAGSYINIGYIAGGFENALIEITDVTGKKVMAAEQATVAGHNSSELDVSGLVNGVYIITVKTESNTYMNKLIINK